MTAFVIVKVTPDGTVAVTPLLIVKAQPVKSAAKGEPNEESIIMFLVASGVPLLQEDPFHVVLGASAIGTFDVDDEVHPPLLTVKVYPPTANPVTV